METEILWYLIIDLPPRSPVWPDDNNFTCNLFCLSSPSIWYATWPCLIENDPLGTPSAPKSHTWAWPRWQNENPVWYVLNLSFLRKHTMFCIKIFEIDFVIEMKWYLLKWNDIWPFPRAPGGWANKYLPLHAPFMWVTLTPNLKFRPMVYEEIACLTHGGDYLIFDP